MAHLHIMSVGKQARTLQTFLRTINNLYYLRRLLLNKAIINLSAQVLIQMAQSHSSDFQEMNTHESSCNKLPKKNLIHLQ